MRYVLASLALVSCFVAGGCQRRDNTNVVVERNGHATVVGENNVNTSYGPVANPQTEQYYVLQAGESLYTVGKKFGCTTEWLIKRNEISDKTEVKPGLQLIVKRN